MFLKSNKSLITIFYSPASFLKYEWKPLSYVLIIPSGKFKDFVILWDQINPAVIYGNYEGLLSNKRKE
jgi:hypothetical protein